MSKYLSHRFDGMTPYVPGEQPQNRQYIKLNTNESPFPPSPMVLDALSRAEAGRLNLYSDPDTREASAAIADYYGLSPRNVLLGNGSDELLSFCFQAFCDEAVPPCYPSLSYGFYKVFSRIYCLTPRVVAVDERLQIDPRDYHAAGGTVILANPNAPTGQVLSRGQIEDILKANPDHVVVIDEAYADFCGESCYPLLHRYDNLVVVRTMSKSRNLAGARLGYAMAAEALIADLNTMKFSFNPYNINRLSLLAAAAAIRDEAYFQQCVSAIQKTRADTAAALTRRGFTVLPSGANFLFVKPLPMDGGDYYRRLKAMGVLVRHFDDPTVSAWVRITIGAKEQMDALLAATDQLLGGNNHANG